MPLSFHDNLSVEGDDAVDTNKKNGPVAISDISNYCYGIVEGPSQKNGCHIYAI